MCTASLPGLLFLSNEELTEYATFAKQRAIKAREQSARDWWQSVAAAAEREIARRANVAALI